MPTVDLVGPGDLLLLAFVAVGVLLAGLTLVERWLTTQTAEISTTTVISERTLASEATPDPESMVPPAAPVAEPPDRGDGEADPSG